MPQRVHPALTSLILLAITITPATARPVLMFCVRDEESSEGFRVDRMTVTTQLNMCCTMTVRKTLTEIIVTQGASKTPLGTTADA